jgi:hypothetical protein
MSFKKSKLDFHVVSFVISIKFCFFHNYQLHLFINQPFKMIRKTTLIFAFAAFFHW